MIKSSKIKVPQSPTKQILDLFFSSLTERERSQVLSCRIPLHRHRSLFGKVLRRFMVSQSFTIPWNNVHFYEAENKKPFLISAHNNNINCDLNISHSGDWIIGIVSNCARVGCDIEKMLERRPANIRLCQRVLSVYEREFLEEGGRDLQTRMKIFYRFWCATLCGLFLKAILKRNTRMVRFVRKAF
ncbi:hypothetical protein ACOME3_000991 [Neoechinorhynchus agilis]